MFLTFKRTKYIFIFNINKQSSFLSEFIFIYVRNIFDETNTIEAVTVAEKRKYLQALKQIDSNYERLSKELESQVKSKHEQLIRFTTQNK